MCSLGGEKGSYNVSTQLYGRDPRKDDGFNSQYFLESLQRVDRSRFSFVLNYERKGNYDVEQLRCK